MTISFYMSETRTERFPKPLCKDDDFKTCHEQAFLHD